MKRIPKRILVICRKLKIKVTKKTKSGRRVYKKLKVLKKEIKIKIKKFQKKKKSLKKVKKSSKKVKKSSKKVKKSSKKSSFGLINQARFNQYNALNWVVPKNEYSKNAWKRVKRNCEDGESQILGDRIIPGMYVNLGNKKCLSARDVINMVLHNGFTRDAQGRYLNPFTRARLTVKQIIKINDIIQVAGYPPIENIDYPFQAPVQVPVQAPVVANPFPNLPNYDDYHDDMERYSDDLVNIMMSGTLTEPELKQGLAELADIRADRRRIADRLWNQLNLRDSFWRIHEGRIQFNRNLLFPQTNSPWVEIREIYDEDIFGYLGDMI